MEKLRSSGNSRWREKGKLYSQRPKDLDVLFGANKELIIFFWMMSGWTFCFSIQLIRSMLLWEFGHFLPLDFSPHILACAIARWLSAVLGDPLFLPAWAGLPNCEPDISTSSKPDRRPEPLPEFVLLTSASYFDAAVASLLKSGEWWFGERRRRWPLLPPPRLTLGVDELLRLCWTGAFGSYVWEARYDRAVTTSPIKGRVAACSCKHIAATAKAWYSPLMGKRPWSNGSAILGNFLRSLNRGRACKKKIRP
jgi:hypothetical protein